MEQLYLGLISGTSIDGIDAALVSLPENKIIEGITVPYSEEVKAKLVEAMSGRPEPLSFFSQLSTLIGREFAKAALTLLKTSKLQAHEIRAIGSHGQTLCHDPYAEIPYTVQLGCPATIAELTGITVVADFRTRDLILGGQGAPFAPLYHLELFKDQNKAIALANIGGIANLTFISASKQLWGYDVGPGNCLMDAWIAKHKKQSYDQNGDWAKTGKILDELLASLLKDRYFSLPTPKSIGKEYFSLDWLSKYLKANYLAEDVQATLAAFTAESIASSLKTELAEVAYLLICGGGAHNEVLISKLSQLLPGIKVCSTQYFDINPDYIEAAMFAWLAEKTLASKPVDLRAITGSKSPTILGAIYPCN